jgi:thioredoxin-like negative regulator of GroEL
MKSLPASIAGRASAGLAEPLRAAGPLFQPRAALAACAILAAVAAGCGPSKLRPIDTEFDFNRQILKAERPAVVYFTKEGCAACMFLNPCMDQLYDEYQDRVEFAEFDLMTFWGTVKCETVWKRYRVALLPTVVLFVGGKEKQRWVGEFNRDAYRKTLNEVVGPPAPQRAPTAALATTPP